MAGAATNVQGFGFIEGPQWTSPPVVIGRADLSNFIYKEIPGNPLTSPDNQAKGTSNQHSQQSPAIVPRHGMVVTTLFLSSSLSSVSFSMCPQRCGAGGWAFYFWYYKLWPLLLGPPPYEQLRGLPSPTRSGPSSRYSLPLSPREPHFHREIQLTRRGG